MTATHIIKDLLKDSKLLLDNVVNGLDPDELFVYCKEEHPDNLQEAFIENYSWQDLAEFLLVRDSKLIEMHKDYIESEIDAYYLD